MSPEPKTVLYVEDNAINVGLVEAIFESYPGVRLLTAVTGRDGLDLALQHGPALILLDMNLTDMDGEHYLRELRTHPTGVEIPVVIVSGDAISELQDRFRDLGIADYVAKPFNIASFKKTVDRLLEPSTEP